MSTIEETVAASLQKNGYGNYTEAAKPVIADLVKREQEIHQALHTVAVEQGLSGADATRIFEGVGLTAPAPEQPAAEQAQGGGDLESLVRNLAATVNNLVDFARSKGMR